VVKDGDGLPIGSATVEVRKADGGEVVDVKMTDGDGVFGFSDVAFGSYKLVVSRIGYVDHQTEPFTLSGSAVTYNAGDIVLEEGGEVEKGGIVDWVWVGILIGVVAVGVLLALLGRRRRRGEEEQ
jgi:hypothetical protein